MDMSTFYDTINLQRLQTEALNLQYPSLMLEMALQVYHGPKAIVAALQPWQQAHPNIHLSSWVDDVGFDTASRTPVQAARPPSKSEEDSLCHHRQGY